MSLHALAHHMATTGRGPDSMLVHMSPREVQGLQTLAMAHGGSLTINPQTGLPEAGFLDSLLPALAGFALNAFVPGLGEAVGGMFGLGGAAGTGIAVGGATALASGDLSKGLMAGLGAYGGAGIGGSLASAGDAAMAGPPASAMGVPEGAAVQAASPVGTLDRLQAGIGVAGAAPTDFVKSNMMNLGFAAAPALSGAFDEQTSSAPKIHPGYIRVTKTDPVTGRSYQTEAVKADEWGSRPAIEWGGVPKPQGYADGGTTTDEIKKGVPVWGGVGAVELPTQTPEYSMLSDSEKAQRYLMGKGPNPFLFYHKAPTVNPVEKAAEATKEMATVIEQQQRGGGGNKAFDAGSGSASTNNPFKYDPNSLSGGIVHALLNPTPNAAPIVDTTGYSSVAEAEAAGLQKLANQYGMYNNPNANLTPTGTNLGTVSQPNPISGYSIGPAPTSVPAANPIAKDPAQLAAEKIVAEKIAAENAAGSNHPTSTSGGTTSDRTLSEHISGQDSANSRDSDARGGFLNHGRFDQRYAYGGGIAALAGGGMYNLGSYSDGGRLLRGPGDGVSDSIPAVIGQKQPARLADGEFVIPARIVSEIGNGSTEAGARKLYAMMDRVQKARTKTVGRDKVAANSRAEKYLPA